MKFHCKFAVSSDSGDFCEKSRGCIVLKYFIRGASFFYVRTLTRIRTCPGNGGMSSET